MKQNIPGICRLAGLFIITLAALIGPTKAVADGISYQFDAAFPGDPKPDTNGNPAWLEADFINVSNGAVKLTISTSGLTGGDFINGNGSGANGGLFFNLNPSDNVSNLNFSVLSGGSYGPTVSLSEATAGNGNSNNGGYGFKSDGDGYYDIQIDFQSNFGAGSTITFDITGISTLTASDFEYTSILGGGEGDFYAAAHIQGITGQGGSTWIDPSGGPQIIPVPEPVSSSIMIAGLGLLGAARLWLRRS